MRYRPVLTNDQVLAMQDYHAKIQDYEAKNGRNSLSKFRRAKAAERDELPVPIDALLAMQDYARAYGRGWPSKLMRDLEAHPVRKKLQARSNLWQGHPRPLEEWEKVVQRLIESVENIDGPE
jgi:hypothetical protein